MREYNEDELMRGDAGLSAKSVFFEEYNDIDIYIEDTGEGYKKIFTEILSRLFKGRYRVKEIFPLGGKDNVVSECEKWNGKSDRARLYIVDGDLHLIVSEDEDIPEGLYELPMYCIENLLVDEEALVEVLNEEETVKLKDEIRAGFNFKGWLDLNYDLLCELFSSYAACFELCPDVQTVAFSVKKLVSSNEGVLNREKVKARVEDVRNECVDRVGEESYDDAKSRHEGRIRREGKGVRFFSGKDYLLPLLYTRFRSTVKTNITNLNFKLRLSMKCDLEDIKECEKRIVNT